MKRKRKKKAAAKLLKKIRMFPNLALRHGKRILSRFSIAVSREAEKEPFSGTYGTIPLVAHTCVPTAPVLCQLLYYCKNKSMAGVE